MRLEAIALGWGPSIAGPHYKQHGAMSSALTLLLAPPHGPSANLRLPSKSCNCWTHNAAQLEILLLLLLLLLLLANAYVR